ncbi:Oidioi.mRNA.OKI2018_I69.XSR.g14977.t1.cds [Oikopleura dioica]|uniref:Oidioi.mRNA.OKI2018_I69.XSR.g14977.t1.cds n=1 Tax=Oikopleura dioica TaxID=34765 RepID=A0ABN7SBV2_OIKDI|nr:Oidioi.mRNA.OKI2018_I69.XSR.g14977.t1.cds [Oikopleura dioica]
MLVLNESYNDPSFSVTPGNAVPFSSNTHPNYAICKIQNEQGYHHEFDTMNALAWVECFLPVFLWVGNCVFNGEGDRRFKLAGTALCGLLSLIAGPMYLTWFYQCPQIGSNKPVKMQRCFKAHVSLCLGCVILGALAVVQVVFTFLGVLMCADCKAGFRLKALFGAIFM